MPGTPFMQAMEAKIAELGGDDWVFDQIADAVPVTVIARRLGVSKPMLYRWRKHGPRKEERMRRWEEAKKESAESYADESVELLDDLAEKPASEVTPAVVTLTTKRSEARRWLAQMRDPEKFGEKAGVQVTVNLGQLHLDALRAANRPALPAAPKQIEGEVVDAEIVEE